MKNFKLRHYPAASLEIGGSCCHRTLEEERTAMPTRTDYVVYLGADPVCLVRNIPRGRHQRAAIDEEIRRAGIPWPPLPGPDNQVTWKPKSRVSQGDWLRAQNKRLTT